MNRWILLITLTWIASSGIGLGCVNTSYSRTHEQQITGETVKIIMGEIPHHGEAFYLQQLALTEGRTDVESVNDRAVAYLKLGQFEVAEKLFLKIEQESPGRYRTWSNLGVLYKKMERYDEAVAATEKALEIQPEGHLGLGDYYLRMLEWRAERAKTAASPTENFLGVRYDAGAAATAAVANREHLEKLIINDYAFADTYIVLGDVLFEAGELELAYRAYRRAELLGRDDLSNLPIERLNERVTTVRDTWERLSDEKAGFVYSKTATTSELGSQRHLVRAWEDNFAEAEEKLIAEGLEAPDFDQIENELVRMTAAGKMGGKFPIEYLHTGLVEGSIDRDRYLAPWIFRSVLSLLGFVAVLVFLFVVLPRFVRSLNGRAAARSET